MKTVLMLVLFLPMTGFGQSTISLYPIADATVVDGDPNGNYVNHPNYCAYSWTCSGTPCLGRAVMMFDLSPFPVGAIILSSTLYLSADPNALIGYAGQPTYGIDNAGSLQRIMVPWNDNTVTWNNQPVTTIQNEAILAQSTSTNQDYAVPVDLLVQDMVNNPSASFGFLLREVNEPNNFYNSLIFGSRDNPVKHLIPRLEITFLLTGTEELSPSTGMLVVYPDPVVNDLKAKIVNPGIETIAIKIFNAVGAKVMVAEPEMMKHGSEINIDVHSLPPGIYWLETTQGDHIFRTKFVKE